MRAADASPQLRRRQPGLHRRLSTASSSARTPSDPRRHARLRHPRRPRQRRRPLRPHPRRPDQRQLRHQPTRRARSTIDPAPLTVTAHDAARSYGARQPRLHRPLRRLRPRRGRRRPRRRARLRHRRRRRRARSAATRVTARRPHQRQLRHHATPPARSTVDPAPLTVTALDAARPLRRAEPRLHRPLSTASSSARTRATSAARSASPPPPTRRSPVGQLRRHPRRPHQRQLRHHLRRRHPHRAPRRPASAPAAVRRAATSAAAASRRGAPPLTPGDASFRTTVAEAPPALANPFDLTYSLGRDRAARAGAGAPDTQGFVPGRRRQPGFVPPPAAPARPPRRRLQRLGQPRRRRLRAGRPSPRILLDDRRRGERP